MIINIISITCVLGNTDYFKQQNIIQLSMIRMLKCVKMKGGV